jgi:hypothetical protein
MTADEFNASALKSLLPRHLSELTRLAQNVLGLQVDGKCGPATIAELDKRMKSKESFPLLSVDVDGWLKGDGVTILPMHSSWHYPVLKTIDGKPKAIVAHYTSTDPGTALVMAKRRQKAFALGDRAASWHLSIEADGTIIQMARFLNGCWHAGGPTAKPIPNVGPANRTSVGIELVGQGNVFPEAQVIGACRVWKALVTTYALPETVSMVTHQSIDPTRKTDPGPVWMKQHAPRVLNYAFGR